MQKAPVFTRCVMARAARTFYFEKIFQKYIQRQVLLLIQSYMLFIYTILSYE
jgi:hypothetical protein